MCDQFLLRYKYNFVVFTVFFVGVSFFTLSSKFINKLGRISVLICFITTLYIIMSRNIFGYYLIVLQCFSVLGHIFIGILIDKIPYKRYKSKRLLVIFISFVFLGSFYLKSFFYYDVSTLITRNFEQDFTTLFSKKILETHNPTLLLCGLDEGLYLFTKTGIVPNIKYFFYPNINYEYYLLIGDTQLAYIKNSTTDYVAISDGFRYSELFINQINTNYNCIAIHQEGQGHIFRLFEKK